MHAQRAATDVSAKLSEGRTVAGEVVACPECLDQKSWHQHAICLLLTIPQPICTAVLASHNFGYPNLQRHAKGLHQLMRIHAS